MKKLLIAVLALAVSASCMKTGKESASWSRTVAGTITTELSATHEQVYTPENVVATVDCPDMFKEQFDFEFEKVRFVAAMPELAITLPNLTYTQQKNEEYDTFDWVIDMKDVIPTIGGVPYEQYKMSAVKGRLSNGTLRIEFWLTFRGTEHHVVYMWDNKKADESGDEDTNTEK